MRYKLTFQPCQICGRETLHVGGPRQPLRWLVVAVLSFRQRRPVASSSQPTSRCACCGGIPNPDGRHPLRLKVDSAL